MRRLNLAEEDMEDTVVDSEEEEDMEEVDLGEVDSAEDSAAGVVDLVVAGADSAAVDTPTAKTSFP